MWRVSLESPGLPDWSTSTIRNRGYREPCGQIGHGSCPNLRNLMGRGKSSPTFRPPLSKGTGTCIRSAGDRHLQNAEERDFSLGWVPVLRPAQPDLAGAGREAGSRERFFAFGRRRFHGSGSGVAGDGSNFRSSDSALTGSQRAESGRRGQADRPGASRMRIRAAGGGSPGRPSR
jgi:hypothetical protein